MWVYHNSCRTFALIREWIPLQIAFYGLGLNNSIILEAIGLGTPVSNGAEGVYESLRNVCIGNMIFSAAGLIPGYYASFFLIDSWGRKPVQLMGFIMLTILLIIMGRSSAVFWLINIAYSILA